MSGELRVEWSVLLRMPVRDYRVPCPGGREEALSRAKAYRDHGLDAAAEWREVSPWWRP